MDKTIFEFGKNSSRLEKGPKKKTMFGFNVMGFGGGGPKTYKVAYLVLAGGGAGNARHAPGGGGGGMRNSDNKVLSVENGATYTVTVGTGGDGSYPGGTCNNGAASTYSQFSTIQATAGGQAGNNPGTCSAQQDDGGSGSGTGIGNYGGYTPVEGYNGGITGSNTSCTGGPLISPGGGGAGAAGQPGTPSVDAAGGAGRQSSITGSATYYGGGGGGGLAHHGGNNNVGGIGGGGRGGGTGGTNPVAGTDGLGGGGGAGGVGTTNRGGEDGGNGLVIIRRVTADSATASGGTTAIVATNDTTHTFNSSGTYTG